MFFCLARLFLSFFKKWNTGSIHSTSFAEDHTSFNEYSEWQTVQNLLIFNDFTPFQYKETDALLFMLPPLDYSFPIFFKITAELGGREI